MPSFTGKLTDFSENFCYLFYLKEKECVYLLTINFRTGIAKEFITYQYLKDCPVEESEHL
jgi:hypothetical protein